MSHTLTNYNGVKIVTPQADLSADRQALNTNFQFLADSIATLDENYVRNPMISNLDGGGFDIENIGEAFAQGYGFATQATQAASFDGSSYIDTGLTLPTTNFSVAFWYFVTHDAGEFANRPFGAADSSSGHNGVDFIDDGDSGNNYVAIRNSEVETDIPCSSSRSLYARRHVVITLDATAGAICYVNGVNVGSNALATAISTGGLTCKIGASGDGGDGFQGYIQEFQIFGMALNLDQVNELYNGGLGYYGIPSGLTAIAAYHLNGDATDYVGSHGGTWTGTEAYAPGLIVDPDAPITPTTVMIKYQDGAIQLLNDVAIAPTSGGGPALSVSGGTTSLDGGAIFTDGAGNLWLPNLPTSDPGSAGQLYTLDGVLMVSAG